MSNILIYDQEGSHFENVKSSVEHFLDHNSTIFRQFYGGFPSSEILNFCLNNNVDVLIVPYSFISKTSFLNIVDENIAVVIPNYYGNVEESINHYIGTIRVWGGINEPQDIPNQRDGLDFFGEAENFQDSMRIAPSYVAGKVGAFTANFINQGYNLWQARQIIRQNCSDFNNWTVENGFGKLPKSISIPENILEIPPVSVRANLPTTTSLNQGLGIISYQSSDGYFNDSLEGISGIESPILFKGENRFYDIEFSRDYGGDFTKLSFELGEYNSQVAPKKPEYFAWETGSTRRRIRLGRTLSNNSVELITEERKCDQLLWRVFDSQNQLISEGEARINSDTALFESFNNPIFSLTETGNTYRFQFKTRNLFGDSEWSEVIEIVDDKSYQGQVFDFRTTEPEPEEHPVINNIKRQGDKVVILTNVPTKIFRKLRANDEWELISETESFIDDVDPSKSYIYRAGESVAYVSGIKQGSVVSSVF